MTRQQEDEQIGHLITKRTSLRKQYDANARRLDQYAEYLSVASASIKAKRWDEVMQRAWPSIEEVVACAKKQIEIHDDLEGLRANLSILAGIED